MPATPISIVKRAWERIAPLKLAETSWDNVGVMIESPFPRPGKQVLLTIDLTAAVCSEALEMPHCSVIVSYHPPIFRGLKSLTLADPIQASLLKLCARGISVFSPHTSLDATPRGINTWLAEVFGEHASSRPITISTEVVGFEGAGMGKLVELAAAVGIDDVVARIKAHLKLEHVQLARPAEDRPIASVAICAGSGASLFKGVTADLLFTGEMSHHEVLAAVARGQYVVLANHTNTERPYLSAVLRPWVEAELNSDGETGWEAVVSKTDADPLRVV
ncbi:hypothetical protein Q5752_005533 [Cryptotrichosporon argae]